MVCLVDLPTDLIFFLLSRMPLRDALSLTAASKTFRELTEDRTFWLNALRCLPNIQSISNPLELSDLDVHGLKQAALHCVKLDHNWSLPHPRITGEVRKLKLGENPILETNHLFQFPGSELFLFYSSKRMKCFNFGTNEYATVLDLDAYVRCASYDFLPDKSIILGLALAGGPRFDIPILKFLKIELGRDRAHLVAQVLLQVTLARDTDCQKPFVSSQVVGAVQSHGNRTEILAYNPASGGSTVVDTDIPLNYAISRRLNFSFHKDDLYLLADDGAKALVYCCSRDSLPYEQGSATTSSLVFGDLDPVAFPTKIWKRRGPVCSQMLRGANFVKVHDSLGVPLSNFVTTFRFWQRGDQLGAAPCSEISVDGMCAGEHTLNVGSTGHQVVASLLILGRTGSKLVLVRFNPDSNSCSSHELELPVGVGSDGPPPNILSVDDYGGIIWLIEGGDLFSIPYA
ncbi:hypothetical protein DFH06DRAFT_1200716 [Mycena polygramma]|nr:hypothetical protein DFH06DRAFT_1200716 [Mycena polygramma]